MTSPSNVIKTIGRWHTSCVPPTLVTRRQYVQAEFTYLLAEVREEACLRHDPLFRVAQAAFSCNANRAQVHKKHQGQVERYRKTYFAFLD